MERCAVESEEILFKVSQRGRGEEKEEEKIYTCLDKITTISFTLLSPLGEFCQGS